MKRLLVALLPAILTLLTVWGLAPARAEKPRALVVGSKQFTEGRLLSEILAQLLEARTDLRVVRRMDLGGSRVVFSALQAGEIDLYPEYTGTGLLEILGAPRSGGPEETLRAVREGFLRKYDLVWLEPLGFNNAFAMVVTGEKARELGLRTISDLKAHPSLRYGISLEFLERADGWNPLLEAYGLPREGMTVRGLQHGLAYEALTAGQIDVTNAYTTDGKLERFGLVALEDDRGFFPPYHAVPVIRGEILRAHPEVGRTLAMLAGSLTDRQMQSLNYRVEERKESFEAVAADFLKGRGLVKESRPLTARARSGSFLQYLVDHPRETWALVRQHLALTGLAVLLACLVGIPLGIGITRWTPAAPPVLAAAGVIQTIPSLALLAFLIPVPGLGLGARTAVLALSLYAVLPILRNTWTGLRGVDAGVLEAARGMGMRPWQVLTMVELPLAVPTIMAGLRTSAVITVGMATLAAFIGAGGLGEPILTGLYLNDNVLILAGAVPAALLAVLVDLLLGRLEGLLAPRGQD